MYFRHTAAAVEEEGRGRVVVMFGPLAVKRRTVFGTTRNRRRKINGH
jgi:hypothetical protein